MADPTTHVTINGGLFEATVESADTAVRGGGGLVARAEGAADRGEYAGPADGPGYARPPRRGFTRSSPGRSSARSSCHLKAGASLMITDGRPATLALSDS